MCVNFYINKLLLHSLDYGAFLWNVEDTPMPQVRWQRIGPPIAIASGVTLLSWMIAGIHPTRVAIAQGHWCITAKFLTVQPKTLYGSKICESQPKKHTVQFHWDKIKPDLVNQEDENI